MIRAVQGLDLLGDVLNYPPRRCANGSDYRPLFGPGLCGERRSSHQKRPRARVTHVSYPWRSSPALAAWIAGPGDDGCRSLLPNELVGVGDEDDLFDLRQFVPYRNNELGGVASSLLVLCERQ